MFQRDLPRLQSQPEGLRGLVLLSDRHFNKRTKIFSADPCKNKGILAIISIFPKATAGGFIIRIAV
jgi:hypothetical protein